VRNQRVVAISCRKKRLLREGGRGGASSSVKGFGRGRLPSWVLILSQRKKSTHLRLEKKTLCHWLMREHQSPSSADKVVPIIIQKGGVFDKREDPRLIFHGTGGGVRRKIFGICKKGASRAERACRVSASRQSGLLKGRDSSFHPSETGRADAYQKKTQSIRHWGTRTPSLGRRSHHYKLRYERGAPSTVWGSPGGRG